MFRTSEAFDCDSLPDYDNETVTLKLPGHLDIKDVFWFSVFSITKSVSLAHIYLPYNDLQLPPDLKGPKVRVLFYCNFKQQSKDGITSNNDIFRVLVVNGINDDVKVTFVLQRVPTNKGWGHGGDDDDVLCLWRFLWCFLWTLMGSKQEGRSQNSLLHDALQSSNRFLSL